MLTRTIVEFEDVYQRVIRIRVSKKNIQHNDQNKNVQKDKQRSTKQTHKTKDRVTGTTLKTGDEIRCSGGMNRSCSTSGTSRINLAINPVISHAWGMNREVLTTSRTYSWSFVTQKFLSIQPSHGGDRSTFLFFIVLNNEDTDILGMGNLQNNQPVFNQHNPDGQGSGRLRDVTSAR